MKNNGIYHERILIVDDDPDVTAWLGFTLEIQGFVTRQAADAFSALTICHEWQPHLVLLDLHLGNHQIQGTEVLWSIKNDSRLSSAVVLIYTGCRDEEVRRYCLQDIGADGYLLKGQASGQTLAQALKLWLRRLYPVRSRTVLLSQDLELDWPRGAVTRGGDALPLTPVEFNVLSYVAHQSPRFIGWNDLTRKFWGIKADYHFREAPLLVRACLAHLEHKLGSAWANSLDVSDRGVRWVFSPGVGTL